MTGKAGDGVPQRLTDAQRRAVLGADPSTGRLTAHTATQAALAARGLAVSHGRSGHFTHYLTPQGQALRERLLAPEEQEGHSGTRGELTGQPPTKDGFSVATGHETVGALGGAGAGAGGPSVDRAAEVAAALEGLKEIRRLVSGEADVSFPALWERGRMVNAVSLVLEASGLPPCAIGPVGETARTGYRVSPCEGRSETVLVSWRPVTPDHRGTPPDASTAPAETPTSQVEAVRAALDTCARALDAYGWQSTRHSDRWGTWFLLVSPRRG